MTSAPPISYPRVLFTESQRFRRPWLMALWGPLALLPMALILIAVRFGTVGGNASRVPAIVWIVMLLPLAVAMLLVWTRVTVIVRTDQIAIRYFPFRRHLAHSQVATFEPIRYHWTDFGGWGARWDGGRTWSYTVSGENAIRLVLHDGGKRLVIGTQRPEDLAAALEEAGIPRASAATRDGTANQPSDAHVAADPAKPVLAASPAPADSVEGTVRAGPPRHG